MWLYVIAVIVVWLTYRWFRNSKTIGNYRDRYVFITGCDSGFGNMLTKRLDGLGFHVYSGCLTDKGMKTLDSETSPNVTTVRLDVTNTESIQSAFDVVKSKLPENKGLWGIVNNAGIAGRIGPTQWLSKDDYENVLAVNTLGMIETTRIFLALVLKSRGRVVNITSMMGRIAAASAPYVVSKYAAEGYSDTLRRELYKRGVTVHIIEPGFFQTDIAETEPILRNIETSFNRIPKEMQDYFGQSYKNAMQDNVKNLLSTIISPHTSLVIDAYTHALTATYPKYRYVVGNDANYIFRFLWSCPEWLSDFIMSRKHVIPQAEQN